MAHIDVMEFIGFHAPYSIMIGAFGVIGTLIMCILLGDGKGDKNAKIDESKAQKTDDFTPNPIKALVRSFRSPFWLSATSGARSSRWAWRRPWCSVR